MTNNQMMQIMNMMNSMNNGPVKYQGNFENNLEDKELNENPPITIIFRKQREPPIMIQFKKKDKVSDAIKKYRLESGDNDYTVKFIYNAKALHPSLTLEESDMSHNGNVFVVVTEGVKGG